MYKITAKYIESHQEITKNATHQELKLFLSPHICDSLYSHLKSSSQVSFVHISLPQYPISKGSTGPHCMTSP